MCVHAQSYLTLCNPMGCSPPGSSVHGIVQARTLEWLPFLTPGDHPDQGRDQTRISCVSCISYTETQIPYHCATQEDP